MTAGIVQGIFLPFFGTVLGSARVFVMRNTLHADVQRALTAFAVGVMVAASVWSLLIPAMEQAAGVVLVGWMAENGAVTVTGALALSFPPFPICSVLRLGP